MAEQRKRKWGDRRDGYWVKDVPGLTSIMANLWPNRTDCEVCLHDKIDATELVKYVAEKNLQHPEFRTTVFHCFIMSVARMLVERPKMNRFVQGRRTYQRNEISLSFVAKRRFEDHSEESLLVFKPKEDEVLDNLSRKISGEVKEVRTSDTATQSIDGVIDAVGHMPRLLLMAFLRIIRWLDFWGLNFKALTEGDTHYTSVLLTNLGSIQCPSVYHHLANYGTNSIIIAVGTLHKEEMLMPDGHKEIRDVIDFSATLDERIADGFYFARSLRLVKHIFAHPELLDRPLNEYSEFEY